MLVVMVTGSEVDKLTLREITESINVSQLSGTQWSVCHLSKEGLEGGREGGRERMKKS